MSKEYTLPEDDAPKMAGEPAVAYAQPATMHVNLSYDIPQRIDTVRFRTMMDSFAMDIISSPETLETVTALRQRLVHAAEDAKEGRTISCEEFHENIEKKFPWLCHSNSYTSSSTIASS